MRKMRHNVKIIKENNSNLSNRERGKVTGNGVGGDEEGRSVRRSVDRGERERDKCKGCSSSTI